MASYQPSLSIDNINPNVKVMEYAVRGPLVIRAGEIEKELEKVRKIYNFLARAYVTLSVFGRFSIVKVKIKDKRDFQWELGWDFH